MKKDIIATVVYDGTAPRCEGQCGPDWSSTGWVSQVKERIKERFGASAVLETVDITVNTDRAVVLKRRFAQDTLASPSLLVNNGLRISGEFDARQLMDAIEVELEINGNEI